MNVSEWIKSLCIAAKQKGYSEWHDPQLLPQLRRIWDSKVDEVCASIRKEFGYER